MTDRFCLHSRPVALCAPCSRAGFQGVGALTVARALGAEPVDAADPRHDPETCPGCIADRRNTEAGIAETRQDTRAFTLIVGRGFPWVAETADLIQAFVSGRWTADLIQGQRVVVEPVRAEDDQDKDGRAYSFLCARVPIVLVAVSDAWAGDTMSYDPATVGEHRFRVSEGLWERLRDALRRG